MNNTEIKKIHSKILVFWKKIQKLLNDNNIRYTAIYGTAIGTIREKGFIPWDDDMDIMIWEEDVPKFKEAISNSLDMSWGEDVWAKSDFKFKIIDKNCPIISPNGFRDHLFIDVFIGFKSRRNNLLNRLKTVSYIILLTAKLINKKERLFLNKIERFGYLFIKFMLFPLPKKIFTHEKVIRSMTKRKINLQENKRLEGCFGIYFRDDIELGTFENTPMPVLKHFREDFYQYYKGDILIRPKENDLKISHNIKLIE